MSQGFAYHIYGGKLVSKHLVLAVHWEGNEPLKPLPNKLRSNKNSRLWYLCTISLDGTFHKPSKITFSFNPVKHCGNSCFLCQII